jgi:hypothetical protein
MSKFNKALVVISAILATDFVMLWLPEIKPLRMGVMTLTLFLLVNPAFPWPRLWLVPVGAAVAAGLSLVLPEHLGSWQWLVPIAIFVGLAVQVVQRYAKRQHQ